MAQERLDQSLPLPMLARRIAARIGRNFSETIHMLIELDGDVEAVVRYFDNLDPAPPKFEPIVICKAESEPIVVDPPNGATVIDEMVLRGVPAPAAIRTARGVRLVYASHAFAR